MGKLIAATVPHKSGNRCKSVMYGTTIELVDRWYPSSKTCSSCGHIQSMPLKERVFECQNCGIAINRDLNAAINLTRQSGMSKASSVALLRLWTSRSRLPWWKLSVNIKSAMSRFE